MALIYALDKISVIVTGVGQCVYDALDVKPHRVCLMVPGEIAWDECECGMLTQTVERVTPGTNFPIENENEPFHKCGPPLVIVSVQVVVARCVQIPNDNGHPPKCSALQHDALQLERDRFYMIEAVTCCLQDMYENTDITAYSIGSAVSVGPGGMCAGVQMGYRFGLGARRCC
jgi:hypothetical protein